jgi:hypothetical protein
MTRHRYRSTTTLARRALLTAILATGCLSVAGATPRGAPAATTSTWCASHCAQVIVDWNLIAYETIHADTGYANPMAASRTLAMMHLAMHDAINAVQPRYARYAEVADDRQADPAVAAIVAAHEVLRAEHPKQAGRLEGALARTLLDAGVGPAMERGKALGRRSAAAVLAKRRNDGADATEPYTPRNVPGAYRFVPGTDFIAAAHWRHVQPFALTSPAQFRMGPPPALDSAAYRRAFDEVRSLGARDGAKRSQDQTHFAAYWYEFSDIGWNRVARAALQSPDAPKLDLAQTARLFAQLNAAMADAYIAGWDAKLHYDFWRPVTAILASGDTKWTSMLPTPPIQDYPSTHSALGAAAASVLAANFRSDRVRFSMTSPSALPTNPTRSFASFSAAARENAESRVTAGLHFRFAIEAGLKLGQDIGREVDRAFLPALD